MTDRPMLFSAPMVRALLDGRKTQTRRLIDIKPTGPILDFVKIGTNAKTGCPKFEMKGASGQHIYIPQGKHFQTPLYTARFAIGDRLYVRETFRGSKGYDNYPPREWSRWPVHYEADGAPDPREEAEENGKLRPGIHMPRWATRLTLAVTDVRVERLQHISASDAVAEGIEHPRMQCYGPDGCQMSCREGLGCFGQREAYFDLWDAINVKRATKTNPWVVAVTFTVLPQNIDTIVATKEPAHV